MRVTKSIFISHSSRDNVFTLMLAEQLRQYGIDVWIDEFELYLGDQLDSKIFNAIEKADYLAVVLSRNSIESEWVQKEIMIGETQEKIQSRNIIIPIVIDEITIPKSISDRVYADFRDRELYHQGFHQFLKLVGYKSSYQDNVQIFLGRRAVGWENWSWDCECDEQSHEYVWGGCHSISATLRANGGLAFAFRTGLNTSGYRLLAFAINGGNRGGQRLRVFVNDRIGNGIRAPVSLGALPPKEWVSIGLTLKELNAENIVIVKINIADNSGDIVPMFFLNDLKIMV